MDNENDDCYDPIREQIRAYKEGLKRDAKLSIVTQSILLNINIKEEHIQVHIKYPPKYSPEDKKLADYLELELKAAFGRYYVDRNAKAIDIDSEEI